VLTAARAVPAVQMLELRQTCRAPIAAYGRPRRLCCIVVAAVLVCALLFFAKTPKNGLPSPCAFAADTNAYSQGGREGEFMALYERYFCDHRRGTFVEIDSQDGSTFSNTKFFEDQLGWTGALIGAQPQSVEKLNVFSTRPRSTKLISTACGDGLGTTNLDSGKQLAGGVAGGQAIVPCAPLGELVATAGMDSVDLFVLDTGGDELQVLQTMHWSIPVGVWMVKLDGTDPTKDQSVRDLLLKNGYTPPSDGWSVRNTCKNQRSECPPNEVFEGRLVSHSRRQFVDDPSFIKTVLIDSANHEMLTIPGNIQVVLPKFYIFQVDEGMILNPTQSSVGLVVNASCIFSLGRWHWAYSADQIKRILPPQHPLYYEYDDKSVMGFHIQSLVSESRWRSHEDIITFDMVWSEYFQHVVLETLPRLILACAWIQGHTNVKIGVGSIVQQRFIQDNCEIATERFRVTRGAGQRYNRVYIPQLMGPAPRDPVPAGAVRANSTKPLGGNSPGHKVVYLRRVSSGGQTTSKMRRAIANEQEMILVLRSHFGDDFVVHEPIATFEFSKHEEERVMLRDARVIIAVHGGALANMIYAPVGTVVMEVNLIPNAKCGQSPCLQPGATKVVHHEILWRGCYFYLAVSLGFEYVPIRAIGFTYDGLNPFHVDMDSLRAALTHGSLPRGPRRA
jgi:hypothetical protein